MPVKYLLSTLLLFFVPFALLAEQSLQWYLLGKEKISGMSGISRIDNEHFLVVHDRKKVNDPRISMVTWKNGERPFFTRLEWCDLDRWPMDLEAISNVPHYDRDFLLLESKGTVIRIQLDEDNHCQVLARFDLPTATAQSNMEGLVSYCFEKDCVLAWAERGDNHSPAKISWARFDVDYNTVETPENTPFEFNAPFPAEPSLRSISDLTIDVNGMMWASSASDPSDEGTFRSAIYKLGLFTRTDDRIKWTPVNPIIPFARYEKDNLKIEGLLFTPNGLIMTSEDEIWGGRITINPFK